MSNELVLWFMFFAVWVWALTAEMRIQKLNAQVESLEWYAQLYKGGLPK